VPEGQINQNQLMEMPHCRTARCRPAAGFSLIEMLLVISIALILLAMGIPNLMSAIRSYQLNAAVDATAGIVQGTRYQAIMHGYPYEVTLDPASNTYQILSEPPTATVFSNLGSAVPISSSPVVIGTPTTFLFKPNGSVSVTAGNMNFTIAYQGRTATITVSNYGSITSTIQ
jgi:prepilin-type N-terminal cleavage/methylation domain-containing protein